MNRSTARATLALLAVVTVTALPIGVAFADSGSSGLVVDDHVETTPKTVTVEGDDYTSSTIGRVSAGDPLTVHVVAPKNVSGVHLFEPDGTLITGNNVSVNDSVTFQTASLAPGEYVLSSHDNFGVFIDAYPVVVTGYDTSLSSSNATAESGGTTNFTVDVTEVEGADAPEVDTVQVVVRDGASVTRVNTTNTGDGRYIGTGSLDPGTYQAYAAVSAAGPNGTSELVGLSDSKTIQVDDAAPTQTENVTIGDGPAPSGGPGIGIGLPSSISTIRLTSLPSGSTLLVGLLLGAMILSTVIYQTLYTLRRR